MFYKTAGLVLRETPYRETDKILTVLTKDRGKVTMRAKGVRSSSSRLKSGCQLLSYADYTVYVRNNMHFIKEVDSIMLFFPLRRDVEKFALASYFAQVSEVVSQEDAPDPMLLSLCLNCLYGLSELNLPLSVVKSAFELRVSCLAGYFPSLDCCSICGSTVPDRFHISYGAVQCTGCSDDFGTGIRLPMHSGTLQAMRYLVSCNIKQLFSFRLGEAAQKELGDISEAYLMTQLERGFSTLDFYKSLQI